MVTPRFSGSGTGYLMVPLIHGDRTCQKSKRFGEAQDTFVHGHVEFEVPVGLASGHVQLAIVFFFFSGLGFRKRV